MKYIVYIEGYVQWLGKLQRFTSEHRGIYNILDHYPYSKISSLCVLSLTTSPNLPLTLL